MIQSNDEIWREKVLRAHRSMLAQVRPCVASISRTRDNLTGAAAGSGIYLKLCDRIYLLTCEHVVTKSVDAGFRLAHLPQGGGFYHAFPSPWIKAEWPVDLAISQIDPTSLQGWDRVPIGLDVIADRYDPPASELLFVSGHPGAESKFRNIPGDVMLNSTRVSYLARERSLPIGFDAASHFALEYEMDLAEATDGSNRKLPPPPGFSGSSVWDTGFVRSGESKTWDAANGKVVGIAQRWVEDEACLICIKAEKLREALLEAVREDFAYSHWVDEGCLTAGPSKNDGDYALHAVQSLY